MTTLQCALCGKKQKIREIYKENFNVKKINSDTFSARRTPDRTHHRFVKCFNCGLIFSNPILPQEKIFNLYANSTFDYGLESSFLKKTYGYYLKKLLKKNDRKKMNLLDIGCGNGFFLEEAKALGIGSVYGIEPGTASVKKAAKSIRKNIKLGLFKKKIYKNNTFDIISCFHTLDHIIDPNEFLQNVYEALKKEGKALFIVHDTDGLSVKLFGERSPIFDIEHIFLFNRQNLTELFSKNKFSVLETFQVTNTYPLSYWTKMSPIPKKLKNSLLLIFKAFKLDSLPISIKGGNIGIIAQK
jgi:SAM-dependent methyltransferase